MAVYRLNWNDPGPPECQGGMLSIGNFDGVHRGHAALIARLVKMAGLANVPAVAMTFDPHPMLLLRPERYEPTLTTIEERARLLQAAGADQVVILHTTPDLLRLSASEFFDQVIRGKMQAAGLVEGPTFGFGRGREGNVLMLARFCSSAGLQLVIVPPVELDDGIVSSSRVRKALLTGDVASASRWLGRPYTVAGVVAGGEGRGRQLGFPTANLTGVQTVVPADGVYAVRVRHAGKTWPAAANIGPNPTFGEEQRKIEAHLIGFAGDLYGQQLTVEFLEYLRKTRRFDSVDELLKQVRQDVDKAGAVFGQHRQMETTP